MSKPSRIPKEFLGAFKAGHRKSVRPMIDEDFAWSLLQKIFESNDSDARKALEFITKFNNEFHKNVIKKGDTKALHNTDSLRKSCYARENAKNRDIYTKVDLVYTQEHSNFNTLTMNHHEDDYPPGAVIIKEHSHDPFRIHSREAPKKRKAKAG